MGRQPGDLQSSFVSYSVCVNVMPKEGIADPQGQTIEHALSRAREMCERLLANTVIEAYEVVVSEGRVAEDGGS